MRIRFWKKAEPAVSYYGNTKARHGTNSAYVMGCRCEDCRSAAREYKREWLAKNRAELHRTGKLPPYVSHGRAYTYRAYGCTCDQCRSAAAEERRVYRAKKALAQ